MKRHNPYSVGDVVKKHNISYDEAVLKIEQLKKKTTITLENLISKYGEKEGTERFETFRKKSSHTKEKYMEKHGDEWEFHWNKYLQSKSCSLEKFIERHGEEGKSLYDEYQSKKSYSNSLKCYKEKYGEDEGLKKYNLVQKKRTTSTLSSFVERFGKEEGVKNYNETNSKKDSSSLTYFIKKFGEKIGKEEYEKKKMRSSPLFCAIKKEYGEDYAIEAYRKNQNKTFEEMSTDLNLDLILKHKTNIKNKNLSKGPVSKESNKFFQMLEILLGRKLKYGFKSDEFKIINVETWSYFCYDCYDEASNTIIEFHGVAWHPKEGELDWINPFGVTYQQIRKKDLRKKEIAESKGFNYFVVYSDEVKYLGTREQKLKSLKEVINANCEKNQKN
jgi:hypothetical protein